MDKIVDLSKAIMIKSVWYGPRKRNGPVKQKREPRKSLAYMHK